MSSIIGAAKAAWAEVQEMPWKELDKAPVFGTHSEESVAGSQSLTTGSDGKYRQSGGGCYSTLIAQESNVHSKIDSMGYVPVKGSFVAIKRVQMALKSKVMSGSDKIAHIVRAFFELIPLLGLLLKPIDGFVDTCKQHKVNEGSNHLYPKDPRSTFLAWVPV